MQSIELVSPRSSNLSHQSRGTTAFDPSAPSSPTDILGYHGIQRTSPDGTAFREQSVSQEPEIQRRFADTQVHSKNDRPGWPRLAVKMSKVPEYAAFPRFRELNTRNLLYYQEELQLLHEQIEAQEEEQGLNIQRYDKIVKNSNTPYHASLLRLRGLLREYNEALLQLSQVSALDSPEEYNMRSLRFWLSSPNGGNSYIRRDSGAAEAWGDRRDISHKIDLRTVLNALLWAKQPPKGDPDLVVTHPKSKTDGLTKWMVYYLVPYIWSLAHDRRRRSDEEDGQPGFEDCEKSNDDTVERVSEGTALRLTSGLSTIVACLLPVVSIVVLKQLSRTRDLLLCITGFAIVFAAGLIFLTQGTSSRTEIFAATAAFSAVMVVFISDPNINVQMPPGTTDPPVISV